MISVLLVDDHSLVRQGIRLLLDRAPGIEVIGEAGGGAEAVEMASALKPDVVLMDITMPEINGIEAARMMRELDPRPATVILSMHSDNAIVREALQAGVNGYVPKGAAADELILAVQAAGRGGTYLSKAASETARSDEIRGDRGSEVRLTAREREVLKLIGDGLINRAIASRLGLSVKTVERHRTSAMHKLDAHTVVELVRAGVRHGVIRFEE